MNTDPCKNSGNATVCLAFKKMIGEIDINAVQFS